MFYPLYADYEVKDKPIIKIFGRNEKGEKVIFEDKNFEPYFYAIPEQDKIEEIKKRLEKLEVKHKGEVIKIKRIEIVEKIDLNKKLKVFKIFCNLPRDVTILKEPVRETKGILHKREYDIPFAKRYIIDKQINFLSPYLIEKNKLIKQEGTLYNPKVAAFDIEIYKPTFDAKENKIICIGLYSKDKKIVLTWKKSNLENVIVLKDEKEMLRKFFKIIEEFDVLISYNGDNFDLPFLKVRAEELKVEHPIVLSRKGVNFKNCLHVDLYNIIFKHLSAEIRTRNLKLDEIARFFIGEGKEDLKLYENDLGKDIWDSNDIKKIDEIFKYNLQDCKITYLVGEKILPLEYRFSNLVGLDLFDVTRSGYSQLVESYLIREAVRKGILIKNRPTDKELEKRREQTYIGAYVHEPKPGIYEGIHVLDFKSLYPTILVSHNISPDTLDDNGELEVKINGKVNRFTQKRKGFIVDIVDNLIKRRIEIKKKQGKGVDEKALKLLANSTYGYLGFFAARWYCLKCAESITALGRKYIKGTIEKAEKRGFKVIYGDTDSLMISGDKEKVKKFLEEVNKELPGIMELEYEGFYKRGIFVGVAERGTKKRYALIDENGNIEIKGFEYVRGDWSEIAKETQEKVLEFILKGDEKRAIEYVKEVIKKIKNGEIEKEKLIISRQLTKNIESYEQIGPHVKVARELKSKGIETGKGTLIHYIITKSGKSISEKARWYEDAKDYDSSYYINHQVIPAALRILSVLGYTEKDLIEEQRSLSSF
jgi:DNA polymerase I